MKKIIIVLCMVLLATVIPATSANEKETKYRVEIKIVYNELNAFDAAEMLKDILNKHKDACIVETKTKKAEVVESAWSENGSTMIYNPLTGIITTE